MNMTRRVFLGSTAAMAACPKSVLGGIEPRDQVDASWAEYFGCSTRDLSGDRTVVVPHRALAGDDGVLVFRHKAACIVSVPHTVPEIERSKLRRAGPDEVCEPSFLSRVFMVRKDRILGPCDLAIADRSSFVPPKSRAYPISWKRYLAMYAPWADSRRDSEPWTLFGVQAGLSEAFGGYLSAGGKLALMAVFEDLHCLGEIWAMKLLGTATADALEKGLVPAWRTGPGRDPMVDQLKRFLGFRTYAATMHVQLVETEF